MSNNSSNRETDLNDVFGPIIYQYTRAQAIEDGVLVDVSETAKEAGWKSPVALTSALWADIKRIPAKHAHENVDGRVWDVLWMASLSARGAKPGVSRFSYKLILHRVGNPRKYAQLVCDCGPGDDAEPVVTVGYAEDF